MPDSWLHSDAGWLGLRTQRGSRRSSQEVVGFPQDRHQTQAERKWEQSLLKIESADRDRVSGKLRKERRESFIFA